MDNTRAVRVIMYDLRDHPQRERREAVLRISGSEGDLLLQGRCYGDDPRSLGQRIADGLGVDYVYVGPADAVGIVTGPVLPCKPTPSMDKKPAGVGAGWLF